MSAEIYTPRHRAPAPPRIEYAADGTNTIAGLTDDQLTTIRCALSDSVVHCRKLGCEDLADKARALRDELRRL